MLTYFIYIPFNNTH